MIRHVLSAERKVDLVLQGVSGERPISELCRSAGISRACYYRWKHEFIDAGRAKLDDSQIAKQDLEERIQQLEAENANLRERMQLFEELCVVD
jgi:transposase